jgi:hypothetical protein
MPSRFTLKVAELEKSPRIFVIPPRSSTPVPELYADTVASNRIAALLE